MRNCTLTKSWVELFVNNADLSFVKVANFGVLLHAELCGKEISELDQVLLFIQCISGGPTSSSRNAEKLNDF